MIRKLTISAIIFIMSATLMAASQTTPLNEKKYKPLRDGFPLEGIDGQFVKGEENQWLFRPDANMQDDQGLIPAGTELEILPSTALGKIISDSNRPQSKNYRIWGTITRFQDKNFIFLIYSLPMTVVEQLQPVEPNKSSSKLSVNDPNDELRMPEEIVEKLKVRKVIQLEQLSKGFELKQDYIMADRAGYITQQSDGKYIFTLDAMGQSIQNISLRLLPCQALEHALERQKSEMEQPRFKVSGIITQYQGQKYLLLQQSTQSYSYGNLGR